MASEIRLGDQFLWVSNKRLDALVRFACDVAEDVASSEAERAHLAVLRKFEDSMWPGIDLDLAEVFVTIDERKWWAHVFHIVARRIYLGADPSVQPNGFMTTTLHS